MPPTSSQVRADVIFGNGEAFQLRGRVAQMVLWLCRQAAKVEQAGKGELLFRFRADQLGGRLSEDWDALLA